MSKTNQTNKTDDNDSHVTSSVSVETTVTITIDGVDVKLSKDQARKLRDLLNSSIGDERDVVSVPYPVPYNPPQPYQPLWYSNGTGATPRNGMDVDNIPNQRSDDQVWNPL